MKYTSDFYSLNGDKYTVNIVTNNESGTTKEITLGVPPFTTEMETDEENIYKPVKYQTATVNIVTDGESDYMFDLYSGEANGTRVTLLNSGTTVWDGYATPVLYNNGYTEIHENLKLECIDGLSILQYYKYNSENKSVVKLIDIVKNILSKCGVYTAMYVSTNTRRTSGASTCLFEDTYISEQNFFDEKKDNETDDDVAWTCAEVLEQICLYCGLTAVAEKNYVYFIDYDAIKNGINTYRYFQINSNINSNSTFANTRPITESLYKGGDNTISLDNVYNKINVKDSFYTFDSIIPDIYKTATNITKSSDSALTNSTSEANGMYGEVVSGADGNMICLVDRIYDPEDEEYQDYNVVFVKYYKNDKYNFTCPTTLNYTDTKTMHGACIAKMWVQKVDKKVNWIQAYINRIYNQELTLDDWLKRNELSNPNFTNYICLFNPETNHTSSGTSWITTNVNDNTALFGGENAYLLIKGSYCYHSFDEDPYPIPDGEADISEGRYAMRAGQTYLLARLKWGNLYYNGSGWTSTVSNFQLPYIKDDASGSDRRADATMFKNLSFPNTVSWRIGTSKKGYAIKCPTNNAVVGVPQLTIYSPVDPNYYSTKSGDDYGKWYKHTRVFLKDFDIEAFIGDPTFSDRNNTDTVYTNVIDNNHVQEFDDIEFKICTNDNKAPNYSSVAYMSGSNYYFLGDVYNQALNENNISEKHYINKFAKQYKSPRIRLQLELENTILPITRLTDKWLGNDKVFIVDSQSKDYEQNKTTITLVEKA